MTPEAFADNVRKHEKTLYHVSSTLLDRYPDRQDAVQSAIALAWQHRSALRDESSFRPWLVRILIRECRRMQKSLQPLVWTEQIPESTAMPERDEALHDAIEMLTDKLRITVVLYYVEGMSLEEIAQTLKIPKGTVKSRLSAGRAALSEILKEEVSE